MKRRDASTREPPLKLRESQAQATKLLIADTAMRLFAQQGFGATATKQIAAEARVSEGLIFHHFPTKLELLRAIVESHRSFSGRIKSVLAASGNRSSAEVLAALGAGFVALHGADHAEAHFFEIVLSESRSNDEVYDFFQKLLEEATSALASYFQARIAAGELRKDLEVKSAAQSLIGSFLYFSLTSRHLSKSVRKQRAKAHIEGAVDAFSHGIKKHSSAALNSSRRS